MANFFLVHSTGGNPQEAWYPWLRSELEKLGHKAIVPGFPTPEGQNLDNWMEVFKNHKELLDENTIYVGRSIGVPFILRILEKNKAGAAFLAAGFCSPIEGKFKALVNSFVERPFVWPAIKNNCHQFFYYYSDNDPYLSKKMLEEVPKNLEIEGRLIRGAGHFNTKSGYSKFQILLEDIKKIL